MAQYIDKSAVVAEIEKLQKEYSEFQSRNTYEEGLKEGRLIGYKDVLHKLDTIEVKEEIEYKQPEYSYFETIHRCGKKSHWNIGDTLAYYEFYSDREGEHVLGKVIKVDFDEEQCDWFYTFENGNIYDEQSLLKEETYKKEMMLWHNT